MAWLAYTMIQRKTKGAGRALSRVESWGRAKDEEDQEQAKGRWPSKPEPMSEDLEAKFSPFYTPFS